VAHGLIESPTVEACVEWEWSRMQHDDERPNPADEPRAPETPPDEPEPTPVQDPPAEPGKAPYVVRAVDCRAFNTRVEP
jgi:hypothetical protein